MWFKDNVEVWGACPSFEKGVTSYACTVPDVSCREGAESFQVLGNMQREQETRNLDCQLRFSQGLEVGGTVT
jgi:hypothetical protein